MYVPSAGNVYDEVTPVPVPLGPNVHAYDVIVPSGSFDAAAVTFTVRPSGCTVAENTALGSTFGGSVTVTSCDTAAEAAPRSSVTTSVTGYVPAAAYGCDGVAFAPVRVAPSPKVHA